jgi:RNA ligase (TIGR02306 family)
MSSLIVEVCRVDAVETHPNADRMCVVTVKGWKVCAGRSAETSANQFAPGELCVYIPPDSILPPVLSDRLGVTKYLSPLAVSNVTGQRPPGGRVRVARLRGFPSYGLIMKPDDPMWEAGKDVADILGITKWEPPPEVQDGETDRYNPAFHRYFSLENWRNFPDLFVDGEEVVLTEKLHGKNTRLALVREQAEDGTVEHRLMAGSNSLSRREFVTLRRTRHNVESGEEEMYEVTVRSQFWECLTEPVRNLLHDLASEAGEMRHDVVVFGELFGSGVQDMAYGFDNGRFAFRVFDITIDGQYQDVDAKIAACARHGVEMVPLLYRGPYCPAIIEQFVSGPTTLCPPDRAGKFKGREGIVITAVKERRVRMEKKMFERAALKAVSFEYLERNDGTEWH